MVMQHTPMPNYGRIPLLDTIRGFALCGIIFANLMSFFGFYSLNYAQISQLPFADRASLFVIDWLVEGKFYTVFAILFGAGFALLHEQKQGADFASYWHKRMGVLLIIGLIHMCFIWHGDILILYSLLGMALPWFIRFSASRLLFIALMLLFIPLLIHLMAIISKDANFWSALKLIALSLKSNLGYEHTSLLSMRTSTEFMDVFIANIYSAIPRPMSYLITGRPFQVLGQFLLGIYFVKTFMKQGRINMTISWQAISFLALTGLLLNLVYAVVKAMTGSPFSLNLIGFMQGVCYHLGCLFLALTYLTCIVKLVDKCHSKVALGLNTLGRMSLTMYLMQTTLCVMLFYGYGLALMNTLPFYLIGVFGAVILIVQVSFGQWWLNQFQQGPIEMIWRKAL
ncbi:DUF418 domain-containing protein [Pseudoalteromonas luteoviolacea]|uniref:DUF418 domain-containing protein n=1 Tax=Pseudoalteromonas luteoviolacea TaxID=43657 RepID=UPI001F3158BD|nr:DUF418 domain-containing protein [Pseudoalteromonas luteoviolacea]MCF6440585.1 DUF418 domain-containing protein [Pseudoalteromonas luteoviolacea]